MADSQQHFMEQTACSIADSWHLVPQLPTYPPTESEPVPGTAGNKIHLFSSSVSQMFTYNTSFVSHSSE